MHQSSIQRWQQNHDFVTTNPQGERRTRYVVVLTFITMLVEICVGMLSGSMALLADGWHMATHVLAFFITLFAYRFAKKHAHDPAYSFGTGKVSVLGGFSSAIALGVIAIMMTIESVERLISPQIIEFEVAILVACIGLIVNLISAVLLHDTDSHQHSAHTHDHNLKAAYYHVLADALTSILAIVALLLGMYFGFNWLDPMMGIVGAIIISLWAIGLIRESGVILLDGSIDADYMESIKSHLEDNDTHIADFHVWRISAHHYAAMITLVTENIRPTEYYKSLLSDYERLSHITIEVHPCHDNLEHSSK